MNTVREKIIDWVEKEYIKNESIPEVLRFSRITPERAEWYHFLDRLALWGGVIFCALGVIFFFAYNWNAMGRLVKFGLVELFIILSLFFYGWKPLSKGAYKAILMLLSLLIGALLALVGQTYQTGADPYQLFLAWSVLIIPWVMMSRLSVMWLLFILLMNTAGFLYFKELGGRLFGRELDAIQFSWAMLVGNGFAWLIWEYYSVIRQVEWLQERWPIRLLAISIGITITLLAVVAVLEHVIHIKTIMAYLSWLMMVYAFYRQVYIDLFMLTGWVLSIIIFVTVVLCRALDFSHNFEFFSLLFVALIVLVMTAIGVKWLKAKAKERLA